MICTTGPNPYNFDWSWLTVCLWIYQSDKERIYSTEHGFASNKWMTIRAYYNVFAYYFALIFSFNGVPFG